MGQSHDDDPDRSAFKRAFADVRPLRARSPKRVTWAPESAFAHIDDQPEPLIVERESNGIITGRRPSTHASILDALEDPRLGVEAKIDLHGLTSREAGREVRRFVRECQTRGKRSVCVIVGKGLHSPGGKGTLRDHVVSVLSRGPASRFILGFRTAPQHLGGSGALVVRLADRA
jgi:DNA-nicking Smr family endonuclease